MEKKILEFKSLQNLLKSKQKLGEKQNLNYLKSVWIQKEKSLWWVKIIDSEAFDCISWRRGNFVVVVDFHLNLCICSLFFVFGLMFTYLVELVWVCVCLCLSLKIFDVYCECFFLFRVYLIFHHSFLSLSIWSTKQ